MMKEKDWLFPFFLRIIRRKKFEETLKRDKHTLLLLIDLSVVSVIRFPRVIKEELNIQLCDNQSHLQ